MARALTCRGIGTVRPVLDVSATGASVAIEDMPSLAPGSRVEDLTLLYGDRVVYRGPGVVVHVANAVRVGIRFCGPLLDLSLLERNDAIVEKALRPALASFLSNVDGLPTDFRAAVADLRHLLDDVREVIDNRLSSDVESESGLFQALFDAWGPVFHALLRKLHELSKALPAAARPAARAYAHRLLWPALEHCGMHRRAHDKRLGYAGDYRMMLLYFTEHYEGESAYGRFLHFAAQRYTLGKAVVARQECLKNAIRRALDSGHPVRIVSIACGPALELCEVLSRVRLKHALEVILVDQDAEALDYASRSLAKMTANRAADTPSLSVTLLHFSVRQILSPTTDAERSVVSDTLGHADLVYCAGLYDYLPSPTAERLTMRIYEMLRPGGRLYLGNLREAGDTTWMMDYVLAWHLTYRDQDSMRDFAANLRPSPRAVEVETDVTGHALLLDVIK